MPSKLFKLQWSIFPSPLIHGDVTPKAREKITPCSLGIPPDSSSSDTSESFNWDFTPSFLVFLRETACLPIFRTTSMWFPSFCLGRRFAKHRYRERCFNLFRLSSVGRFSMPSLLSRFVSLKSSKTRENETPSLTLLPFKFVQSLTFFFDLRTPRHSRPAEKLTRRFPSLFTLQALQVFLQFLPLKAHLISWRHFATAAGFFSVWPDLKFSSPSFVLPRSPPTR